MLRLDDTVRRRNVYATRRSAILSARLGGALLLGTAAIPAAAEDCQFIGKPATGGVEAPLAVDGVCSDPDYNSRSLVIDSTERKTLDLPDGRKIGYTEVKAHFPAFRTEAELPAGVRQSPTTVSHKVVWRFPEKSFWRNRFFQQTYPLELADLNAVDAKFAFVDGGGYTVGISPGSPNVGYRVPAAAAQLAKSYANKLYSNTSRIYGYLYGQSGGSVQAIAAAEATSGVWDGIVPVVIALDGLGTHSFMWGALYALAVPEAKRQMVAEAAAVGSGKDIYAGLSPDERAALDELLNAGFSRRQLESQQFAVVSATALAGPVRSLDPTYEDDFWSKPGYEGSAPPPYLAAAKVDGMASIQAIARNEKGVPTSLAFAPGTVPKLGSIGASGLQFYVVAADGRTRLVKGETASLSGKLDGDTLKLDDGKNDPALLAALVNGGKVRINNRFLLAVMFYPRHSIQPDSPAYAQYRNADGTPKYVQRAATAPFPVSFANNLRAAGGWLQTGRLKVKTIVLENLLDPFSFPNVGGLYADKVRTAMGPRAVGATFRIYYQDNSSHGAFLTNPPGKVSTATVPTGGVLFQALLDLAAWTERGVAPFPSTHYSVDAMNQIVLPADARERGGLQPVVHLSAGGGYRVETSVNRPVELTGQITMPPKTGSIVEYDWYLGGDTFAFAPAVKLATAKQRVDIKRSVSFSEPGEYVVSLRATGERSGRAAAGSTTPLVNIDRVRVVVTGAASAARGSSAIGGLSQEFWDVPVNRRGTQCVVDPRNVRLRRTEPGQPATLHAYGPANAPSTTVAFANGATVVQVDPAAFPINDGSSMTIADAATGTTIGQISFAVLPSTIGDRTALAKLLRARGCSDQLAKLP